MSDEAWEAVENYLNAMIAEYVAIGQFGVLGLQVTLLPLKKRLDAGERSEELYNEIMDCE
jgi:hypothetical protein